MAEGVAVGFEKGMQQSLKRMQQSMSGIVAGSSAGAEATLAKNTNYSTVNRTANIVQNNTFTSREMTPYEQQLQIKRLNRDLARGLA